MPAHEGRAAVPEYRAAVKTNFCAIGRATFSFQNWHSAIELKRYLLRFPQKFPRHHTLGGERRTRYNQYAPSCVRCAVGWKPEA